MVKPTLEGLPTELLILILNEIPDHSSLKSIVLSAPTIYQAYLTARPEILRRMITNLFGPLLGEAILAIRSRDLLFADHKEEAIALLDTWRRKDEIKKRTSSNLRCIDVVDNLQETFSLFRFHNQLEFFLADYAKHAPRPAWIPENDWESSFTPIELSPTEKHRFLRAMCRLQTHGNIFGPAETVPPEHGYCIQKTNNWNSYEPEDTYDDRMLEAYRLFFGAMPPWEYSEMGCIWSYLLPKFPAFYDDIIQSMREIVESSPTSQPGLEGDFEFLPPDIRPPMNPCVESLDGLEGLFSLEQSTKSLAELGPDFLFRILHTSPLSRRDMILTNIHSRVDSFIGIDLYVLYSDEEAIVPLISPADKHSTKNYEELWSHLPSTETPNKAWKKQHLVPDFQGQTFEDALSGMNTEDNWDWGFALWDDERLEAWQALILCES